MFSYDFCRKVSKRPSSLLLSSCCSASFLAFSRAASSRRFFSLAALSRSFLRSLSSLSWAALICPESKTKGYLQQSRVGFTRIRGFESAETSLPISLAHASRALFLRELSESGPFLCCLATPQPGSWTCSASQLLAYLICASCQLILWWIENRIGYRWCLLEELNRFKWVDDLSLMVIGWSSGLLGTNNGNLIE